jgi:hypothetical protein
MSGKYIKAKTGFCVPALAEQSDTVLHGYMNCKRRIV